MTAVMIIGGTDSSGGAGLTRDAFAAEQFGCTVLPIVTAVTAQSNNRVFDARLMPEDLVASQIKAALATTRPAAIKIGMLGNEDIAEAVADAISGQSCPVVLDPVLVSSSGRRLMSGQFPGGLLSQTTLITPNLPEAAALSGFAEAQSEAQIMAQAEWFLAQGVQAVLIKGGHAAGELAVDYLVSRSKRHILETPRLEGATMRGTGCALATAIACNLAQGSDLFLACQTAKTFLYNHLRDAAQTG